MPILGSFIKTVLSIGRKVKLPRPLYQQQADELEKLLRKAAYTKFGLQYDFINLLQHSHYINEFRERVPLFDYDSLYAAWWHKAVNQESDVCWKGKVTNFALSSGTTGAPSKLIPVTKDMLREMKKASLKMFLDITNFKLPEAFFEKQMLMLGGSSNLKDKGGYYIGDLSGIQGKKPPFWLRSYYLRPEPEIRSIDNWGEKIEEIVKHSADWDIGGIVGIPSWVQILLERVIAHHGVSNIHEVWPNLSLYVHGGVAFEPYQAAFDKIMGKKMVYLNSYMASEGLIGYQSRPETRSISLLLKNGIFYEFLPFNDDNFDSNGTLKGNPKTHLIHEVSEDIDYALVMTTCAGAWRYIIGDTVRFTDKSRGEVKITGRTKHFLSITGEHLSVDNMNTAIHTVKDRLHVSIPEFTVTAQEKDGKFTHIWYIGCDDVVDKAALQVVLDHNMQENNDDYRTEREYALQMELHIVPIHIFYDWLQAKGKLGGQSKFPRVMKGAQFADWETFVEGRT
jgi:GH3 auxin-responsive promoter